MIFSKKALQDLESIQNPFKKQIIKKLKAFEQGLDSNITAVQGTKGVFRIRSGDYRIIMLRLSSGKIEVVEIGLRKSIYDDY